MALRSEQKIVSLADFESVRKELREQDLKLVHCHGVFDLLHPGHLIHLEEAREQGDRLVVTVTEDAHVRKGPGRPVFTQDLRMASLAALEAVDWVILSEHETAIPAIEAIEPDVYCKGREYEDADADVTQNIQREVAAVERGGGEVRYLGAVVFSSTKLLNRHFDAIPAPAREFAENFRARYTGDDINRIVDSMSSLKVLVIGDVIIDEYVNCEVLGVTAKDHVPSMRWLGGQRYWGGAYAVARHLESFAGSVTLAGIAGPEEAFPQDAITHAFEVDHAARTVVKKRYVLESSLRGTVQKVFSVNYLYDPLEVAEETRQRFIERIGSLMGEHDIVVITDYGHGLFDQRTMDAIQDRAPYLALNCQTNSANYAFNAITKYRRADTFCLDQTEIAVAFRDRTAPYGPLLETLRETFGAKVGWLTLSSEGALASSDTGLETTPALTLQARDTIGAGDAFFALASLAARLEEPAEVGSFLGNCAGALAVNVTGNAEPVGKVDLLKFAGTVLNV
jgi:rfaE bifunctional protein nucleotidyltransferase chain/domain